MLEGYRYWQTQLKTKIVILVWEDFASAQAEQPCGTLPDDPSTWILGRRGSDLRL